MPRKARRNCGWCGLECKRPVDFYCSNAHHGEYLHQKYIEAWQAGTISGLDADGRTAQPIVRFLREKFSNKCGQCGWCEVNQTTKKVPLQVDHIDGNWRNNIEMNLMLLCPNCHSLTSTFMGLNKGHGRDYRRRYEHRAGVVINGKTAAP